MRRFSGQALPEDCRIALITNDAIGNYVVVTPLIQMLREQYKPSVLHYYGGTRTEELWQRDPNIDWGFPFHGSSPSKCVSSWQEAGGTGYDLVINVEQGAWAKAFAAIISCDAAYVCGPTLGEDGRKDLPFSDDGRGDLWRDKEWIAPDLTERYPFLETGFIGEIFARLCYLNGPMLSYRIMRHDAPCQVPDVLIATAASLPEKLWPLGSWIETLKWLRSKGMSVGLLGAPSKAQGQFWTGADAEGSLVTEGLVEDLRGTMTLPQVADALAKAKVVLTIDNGILHLAAAGARPIVGLFRHGIHRLWAPPVQNLRVITPGEGKEVSEIPVKAILEALGDVL